MIAINGMLLIEMRMLLDIHINESLIDLIYTMNPWICSSLVVLVCLMDIIIIIVNEPPIPMKESRYE